MHSTCITMRLSIVFLALLAFAAAIPTSPSPHAADQELLSKQLDAIQLLENIVGDVPYHRLYEIGSNYDFQSNLNNYENPTVVMYYVGLVNSGHVQPRGMPFVFSISALRKEFSLLFQVLLGAKDYQTFLSTAAWARIHVNQDQFGKAIAAALYTRHDTYGVICPGIYELYPQYFFDTRIIQSIYDHVYQHGSEGEHAHNVQHIYVNYSSSLPYGENQIAYFTDDIGLNAYYAFVELYSYIYHHEPQTVQKYGHSGYQQVGDDSQYANGHGSRYYYIHQQLMARYNLERLGQGLGPIEELDSYYEHIQTPFSSNLRYFNGVNQPARSEHIYVTPKHHNYELLRLVRKLEQRIVEAIDLGHVITPQGTFLSLYQPLGLNILGELIEGSGRSINPRYYGAFQGVAKSLLGNAPEFHNIWEYTPSTLEMGITSLRDPIFYQLYSKILEFFHYYQEALPAYQYNDIVTPGVSIEKVDISDLITYFSESEVDITNAVPHPVAQDYQPHTVVKAHVQRLDHKPYEYTIHVQSQKAVPSSVVRVYVGPKYNYNGQHIDINEHRHYFFELDQFVYDLVEGHNVIVRNSHQATGQSYDFPTIQEIKERVESAIRSQNPHYVHDAQHQYAFPARLGLPKGSHAGFPLQFVVIVCSSIHHHPMHYGPIVEEEWMTYQPEHYQIIGSQEYDQLSRFPIDKVHGVSQTIEVIPQFEGHIITHGNWHWGYLYKKYPGSYYYPHWQQTYYSFHGSSHGVYHEGESHEKGTIYPSHMHSHGISHGVGEAVEHGVGMHPEHVGQEHVSDYSSGYEFKHHNMEGHGVEHVEGQYYGSAHHPSTGGYFGSHPSGTYQGYEQHEQHVYHYYHGKHISDVIGGVISLDGRPYGYPFDRPLAASAFYAPNFYVKDVVVYHSDNFIPYEH